MRIVTREEEIADDVEFIWSNDKTLTELYTRLYHEHLAKGLPYFEVAKSKFTGQIKYLIKAVRKGEVLILDLDTNEEVTL